MQITIGGKTPQVDDAAWVAPNATLVGAVTVEAGASIWYGAVVRADNEPIVIGARTNVQDNCAFHVDAGRPVTLGEGVSIGHGAVVHGATIGDNVLVGMGAIVMNGAVIGEESMIAAGALVTEGMEVPPRSLVAGVPGKVRRQLTDEEVAHLHDNAARYLEYAKGHAAIYEEHRELHRHGTELI